MKCVVWGGWGADKEGLKPANNDRKRARRSGRTGVRRGQAWPAFPRCRYRPSRVSPRSAGFPVRPLSGSGCRKPRCPQCRGRPRRSPGPRRARPSSERSGPERPDALAPEGAPPNPRGAPRGRSPPGRPGNVSGARAGRGGPIRAPVPRRPRRRRGRRVSRIKGRARGPRPPVAPAPPKLRRANDPDRMP